MPQDRDAGRSVECQPDALALHALDRDGHIVADHELFPALATEDQHDCTPIVELSADPFRAQNTLVVGSTKDTELAGNSARGKPKENLTGGLAKP